MSVKIELLKNTHSILKVLKYDNKKIQYRRQKDGYKGIELQDLLQFEKFNFIEEMIICWTLANKNVFDYYRLMNGIGIYELYELYLMKLAIDYEEPMPERRK